MVTRSAGALNASWSPVPNAWHFDVGYSDAGGVNGLNFAGESIRRKVASASALDTSATLAATTTATTAALSLAEYDGVWPWSYKLSGSSAGGAAGSGAGGCVNMAASARTAARNGLAAGVTYTYSAHAGSGCTGGAVASTTVTTATPSLATTRLGARSAEIALSGWMAGTSTGKDGAWRYKANKPPHDTCSAAQTANTANLVGLSANTAYIYSAYSGEDCAAANLLTTSSAFTTLSEVSVSNLSPSPTLKVPVGGNLGRGWATGFTTGSAVGGYTLSAMTARFDGKVGSPNAIAAQIHADAEGKPGTVAATLSGPTHPSSEDAVYTCDGADCKLEPNATYHLAFIEEGTSKQDRYIWKATKADGEMNGPAGAGWRIANDSHRSTKAGAWSPYSSTSGAFQVVAAVNPSLATSSGGATTATLALSGYGGGWWYERSVPGGDDSCHAAASGGTANLVGLESSTTYAYSAYPNDRCDGAPLAAVSFATAKPSLVAVSAGAETGALTLSGWNAGTGGGRDGFWYFKADKTPHDTCSVAQTGVTANLSGLVAGAAYIYKAYSDSGCTKDSLIATAPAFATFGQTVSNLGATTTSHCAVGYLDGKARRCAVGFTTGDAVGGYTLESVTAKFGAVVGAPGAIVATLHRRHGGAPHRNSSAALRGGNPTTAGEYVFTCAGNGCALARDATYFLVLTANAVDGSYYRWDLTDSDGETLSPAGNGWSIANGGLYRVDNKSWQTISTTGVLKVTAKVEPGLSASRVTAATARLTIYAWQGDWWHKRTWPAGGECVPANGKAVVAVSGLTPNTEHNFAAYRDASCSQAISSAHTGFRTLKPTLTASEVTHDSAKLTIGNWSVGEGEGKDGPWWYRDKNRSPLKTCASAGSATQVSVEIYSGYSYAVSAYSDSGCKNEIARASFRAKNTPN